jgi:rare lipoprotein A (peptidoglycan hydrolase)
MSLLSMTLARVLTLSLFVASAGLTSTAVVADDWLEKAFRTQPTATSSNSARTTRKAARASAIKTAAKSSRTKRITIRAARTDDVKPTLRRQASAPVTSGNVETGIASYYWQPQPVASGGRFNPEAMTAAHKYLPFGTRVRVTRADNGRSVEVVINDRGPFIAGRIIDLSRRAARDIGMTDVGITRVKVAILGR